ncbi:MAG: hypothetical protein C4K60_12675 [Ideonella sp. MAG2]|nr:MAG: hypothetical protein C4K60_12675 [Ideonella sp. MAG2]
MPPQRNGLADYILEYLPLLAQDFELSVVSESGHTAETRLAMEQMPHVEVLSEAHFLARQADARAQVLYNVGNNGDCAYMLDHVHQFPGAVIIHDVSLFYLHQVAAQQARSNAIMGPWLAAEGYEMPADFLHGDGSLAKTPGMVYQECLMVKRISESAKGVMVHTAYAEKRLRGGASGVPLGHTRGRPLLRMPHFVLPPPAVPSEALLAEVLSRFHIKPDDFLILVPGFLSGNKMLYEILMAFREASARGLQDIKLLFAGQEREQEYRLSERIKALWPAGDGPLVTGYLSAQDLDILLGRADLSVVLRFPTYGESSGILPRAAMGGGDVITVNIGAYPEFQSAAVCTIPVGADAVAALTEALLRSHATRTTPETRRVRQTEEARRAQALSPQALYPRLRQWLDDVWALQ